MHLKKKTSQTDFACTDSIAVLTEWLPEKGLETLVRLLRENYNDFFGSANKESFLLTEIPASAFVPSAATQDLDDLVFNECVMKLFWEKHSVPACRCIWIFWTIKKNNSLVLCYMKKKASLRKNWNSFQVAPVPKRQISLALQFCFTSSPPIYKKVIAWSWKQLAHQ